MARAERRSFDAVIEEGRGGGALVAIPFDVRALYGTAGQVKVKAYFDGEPYRGSIAPMGGGRHVLGIAKAIRAKIGKDVGDKVKVVLERDSEPRTVETPPDLAAVLKRAPAAQRAFDKLSFTHRK